MGSFRFRKSFNIIPALLKLNINKQSVSVTAGVRGAHATYNSKGYRTLSAGLPGTGLSYRDTRKVGAAKPQPKPQSTPPEDQFIDLETRKVGTTVVRLRGPVGSDGPYDLFVGDAAGDDTWWRVGTYTDNYAAAEAVLQWEAYLQNGGTIAAWLDGLRDQS